MSDWDCLDVLVTHCGMARELVAALDGQAGLRLRVVEGAEPADPVAAGLGDYRPDAVIGYQFGPGSLRGLAGPRWLHLTGTGVDHLQPAGLGPDVLVTTSSRVPVTAVAEYAVAGLFLLTKDLAGLASGQRRAWFSSAATLVAGSTVGVLGAGRIGRAVLSRLSALGARTVAVTRDGASPVAEAARTIGLAGLAAEAAGLDAVIGCLPGGPGTVYALSREVLAGLPAHARVVNVGRASTVDTEALYEALRAGRLAGAFLDVHDVEPLPADHEAWQVPGLVVSPHCAFRFPGEPAAVAAAFLDNLDDLRRGQAPRDRAGWLLEGSLG
ncbi:NAD(P)-dependent oxidoreductase [Jatrophihabitans sp.]|uniref:NAD(P)-dependent oxidoreductase n=1 Tax=Jatrophihabitans sp. TaxID=1932789 RepID=UPI002CB3B67C|nr:NAD(P)-dependent oxidoreductase [Jatrophihabitans sp.]